MSRKILFVSGSTIVSGGEIVLERLIQGVGQFQAVVAVPPGAFADRLGAGGKVRVIRINSLSSLQRASNRWFVFKYLFRQIVSTWKLVRIVRRESFELVVANQEGVAGYVGLAARLTSLPAAWIHHHPILESGTLDFEMARPVSFLVDRIICVSHAVQKSFHQAGVKSDKLMTIHNGLDLHQFDPSQTEPGFLHSKYSIPGTTILLGMIGMIVEWKGQWQLLESIHFLLESKTLRPFHLFVIGECVAGNNKMEDYLASLRKRVMELGLSEHVTFTGRLSEMVKVYRDLDIVLNNSIAPEPFGTTIYEAMAMEKVAIATRVGGSPEIIDDKINGYLVPPGDPAALATAIRFVVDSYDSPEIKKLRCQARAKVQAAFSLGKMSENYSAVFEQLVKR